MSSSSVATGIPVASGTPVVQETTVTARTSIASGTPKDVSLVSVISKVAANILFGIIVLTPILIPISIGGKKINKTKKLNK